MKIPVQQNKGIALITVMLIVALATAAAAAMASRHQLDIRRTENTLHHGQAVMYAQGIEQWVQQILYRDRQDNQTDHLGEDWAKTKAVLPIDGGTLTGEVEDLQGRFNLNNLRQDGSAGKGALEQFRRLLVTLGLNPNLADQIKDWIDADQTASFPEGAEDLAYLALETNPHRTPDRAMQSPSELLMLGLMKPKDYEKLAPFVTALPEKSSINVNTASAEVLMTLGKDLVLADLQALIQARDADPFASVNDMLADKAFAGKNIPADGLSITSKYFMLSAEVNLQHIQQPIHVIYERDSKGIVTTIMRAEGNI